MAEEDGPAGASDRIDLARLDRWLADNVEGFRGPARLEKFTAGQSNPTFRIDSPSGTYVLRRKPLGAILPSAHAVDREFRVQRALHGSGVPVVKVHAYCDDATIVGSAFYVMDFLAGRIFWDPRLPELAREERTALFDSMNATIAALHSVDPEAVGLGDYGRPGNFVARQVARWTKQYRASETETIPAMDRLIEWLPQNLPPEAGHAIVHGDFRLDNLMIHPTEPRVVAILDWELSTLGDSVADFAYHTLAWHIAPDLFRGLAGVDFAALGIPDEAAYVAAYCRRTGRQRIDHWEFYLAFSMFRITAILQGIAKRAIDGNASSAEAAEVGRKARPMAEIGWEIARSAG
jgi:aminoglycoside phosphotransferase (APT) family kinase protein